MLLDSGEELSPGNARALAEPGPVRLRLLEPAPPFLDGQIVQVTPLRAGRVPRDTLVLSRVGGAFCLHALGDGQGGGAAEALCGVVALERGEAVFFLKRGFLAGVPPRWLPRAIAALEVIGRLRRPLTPSLFLGSAAACLAGVREKYNRRAEVRRHSYFASMGLEQIEREIVERHVKPGGRVLDIGCGAGREALGFSRAGFRVVAIDIAPRMIEAARANAQRERLGITFTVQSATELDEPPGSFDGAFWSGSYHHVPGRALRVETLGRIRRALTPEGVLILTVLYRGRRGLLSRSRLVDLLREVGRRLSRTWRLSESGDGYMRELSEASDPREACFFHDFSGPGEARAEIEAAGLSGEEVGPGWWVCRSALS
ncbi:MAG: class I SAM-dependent methyltransferase [Candidatus Rokubacteria bacterium]|nr:class I SAM-dependent methyltransferase [Candidatus Rokubacteria bacterium]